MKTLQKSRPAPSRLLSTLLLRTGVLLFTSLSVTGAFAEPIVTATTVIDATGAVSTVTGHKTVSSGAPNTGAISALIDGSSVAVSVTGAQTGNTTTNTFGVIGAAATGTTYTNILNLGLIAATPVDGAASLLSGVNSGVVTSAVSDSSLSVTATGFVSGVLANNSNSITAATTQNAGSSLISGVVPTGGYTSAADGTATLNSVPDLAADVPPDRLNAGGSIVASTSQNSTAGPQAGSTALLSNNAVTLTATSSALANVVSASPELNSNTLAATYKGNTAATSIAINAGGAPAMTGSAVVTNLQTNVNAATDAAQVAAANTGSTVSLTIDSSAGNANTLTGNASVSGNAISASATGNEATSNSIAIATGVGFTGAAPAAIATNSQYAAATGAVVTSTADLVVANGQSNAGDADNVATLRSGVTDGQVLASVESLSGGVVTVNANSVTARASGNLATGSITATGDRAALDASAALSSTQANSYAPVEAFNTGSLISATVGVGAGDTLSLTNGSVGVTGNTQGATAVGNQDAQSLTLSAVALDVKGGDGKSLTAGSLTNNNATATNVGASVTSVQSSLNSATTAQTSGATVLLDASGTYARTGGTGDNVSGSTLSATGNKQEAVALGASVANTLTLSATTLSGTAGVLNAQITDAASATLATVDTSSVTLRAGNANADVTGSTLAVSGNLQRAIAYGAAASNAVNISATTANVAASGVTASVIPLEVHDFNGLGLGGVGGLPVVQAQYGLLNLQSTQSDVSSTAGNTDASSFGIAVGGALTSSIANNDGNALVAASYANQASNAMTLNVGTLVVPDAGFANVASVTNVQNLGTDAGVTATTWSDADSRVAVSTTVAGAVTASSVTASDNAVQTLAYGNRANSNTLAVTATTLSSTSTAGSVLSATNGDGVQSASAALTVQSAQYGAAGDVTATQNYGIESPAVRIGVTGLTSGSTLAAEGNAFTASAYSNSAANSLSIGGGSITTTGGVQNVQYSEKTVTATIGEAGTLGTVATVGSTLNVNASPTFMLPDGTTSVVSQSSSGGLYSGYIRVATADMTTEQASTYGWIAGTGAAVGNWYKLVTGYNIATPTMGVADGGDYVYLNTTAGTLGVAGARNAGGVLLSVDANVSNSTLSVSKSATNATAVGNTSTNALSVDAVTLTANGITAPSSTVTASGATSTADYNVSNGLQAQSGAVTATAAASYGIDDAVLANTGTLSITGSTLKVDGNAQQATAQANTAINSLALAGTTLTGASATTNLSAAVNSAQFSSAAVSAASNAEFFAPAVVSSSSVSISGNRNVALANQNDVANTLTVSGNSVAPATATAADGVASLNLPTDITTTGALVLNNVQTVGVGGSLSSNAFTQIYNEDRGAIVSTGLLKSTLTVEGNATLSEATANKATNTATVSATNVGTTTVVSNSQGNNAAVTSTSQSLVAVTLPGGASTVNAAEGSTIALNSNITTALARGNAATNVLNYLAGATYSNVGSTGTSTLGASASAAAALSNYQSNTAGVAAVASNTNYSVALNSGTSGSAVALGSNVSVANNTVAATAYGNQANNQLVLAALNSGTPTAAVASYQSNSGAVSATASAVTYGLMLAGGSVAGSTLRSTANAITATAVGNSAVSSILASAK